MTVGDIDPAILEGIPPEELQDFLDWRGKVKGTNISDKTLLATDYLNHFNEIVMLIEMVPDMTMMVEECHQWLPKSYQEHFRDSGFSDRELAINAYEHVPTKFHKPFEESIVQLNTVIRFTLDKITIAIAGDDPERLRFDCQVSVEMIHKIIQVMNGIIHGAAHVMEQAEIDDYLGVS